MMTLKKIIIFSKNNFESIFSLFSIALIYLDLFFTIFKKSSITSICFRATFIVVSLWLLLKIIQIIKEKKSLKSIFKSPTIKQLIICAIPLIATMLVVTIPFFGSSYSISDYFTKYFCLFFVFIYLILLINGKFHKSIPRINVWTSIFIGSIFCVASLFPSLRSRTYTGAYTFNFSNPNTAALVLCFIICNLIYGVFILHGYLKKIIICGEIIFLLFLLYLTQARAPLFSILFALICAFLIYFLKKKNSLIISALLISFILFFACTYVLIIFSLSGGKPASLINIPDIGKGITSRYGVWIEGFKLISKYSFTGMYFKFGGQMQYHNSILDLFVAYGIPCAILLSCSFIYLLSKSFKDFKFVSLSQYIAFFSLFGCLFTGLFESSIFSSPQGLYILFFSFVINMKLPLTDNCLSENNAINFDKPTNKKADVILINSVYKKGSTGKIVECIKNELEKNNFTAFVLYGRKEISEPEYNAAKCTTIFESIVCRFLNKIFTKDYSYFNYFSTFEYIRIINKYKPQVVHLHCLNDHYINQYLLFKYLKYKHIKTVLTLHSENLYVGCQEGHVFDCENWCCGGKCLNCNKYKKSFRNKTTWKKLNRMFTNFNELTITAVSPWLTERAKNSTILSNFDIKTVMNGVNNVFSYRSEKSGLLPNEIDGKKKILFVCANAASKLKGYDYFEQLAKHYENNPNYHFICVSLEDFSKGQSSNITFVKPVKDNIVLSKLYSECDLTLVLSSRETFSMPTAESLCCGTKVVGFKCGGAESIGNLEYSKFADHGDLTKLISLIDFTLKIDYSKIDVSNSCINLYSQSKMVKNFEFIYKLKNQTKSIEINI